jgi:ech hydrogenase subunit F
MLEMLKFVTKNLFSKPATRLYPAYERPAFERTRGRIVFDPKSCILCSICARKCPADAITVDRPNGKWELNSFRCITCGECVAGCPKKCITMSNERKRSADALEIISHNIDVPKPVPKTVQPKAPAASSSGEVAAVKE